MAFNISYVGASGLTVYANIFGAADALTAWKSSAAEFQQFVLESQLDFAILLKENSERTGYYSYQMEENLPSVQDDKYYIVEIRSKSGGNYNRASDTLLASVRLFWDGEKETDSFIANDPSAENVANTIASAVWNNGERTLTASLDPSAENIWQYSPRALTEYPVDQSIAMIQALQSEITSIAQIISDLSKKMDNINSVISVIQSSIGVSNANFKAQAPRIGQSASSNQSSNIKIR